MFNNHHIFLNNFLLLMHLKIITQRQIIPISINTENKPIKTFRKVLLLPLSLLFIIVSLITLVHSPIILLTNLFLQTQFS